MLVEQVSNPVTLRFAFTAGGIGRSDLSDVLVTIYAPDRSVLVSGAAVTEVGDGVYEYTLASNLTALIGAYTAVAKTSTPVDNPWAYAACYIGTAGVEDLDAAISTRLPTSGYTAPDNTTIATLLGVLGSNQGMRNATYSSGNLVSYDLYLYDSAAHATLNDGVTGVTGHYAVANTYDGFGQLLTSAMTRVL